MGIIAYEYTVIGFITFDSDKEEGAARQDSFVKVVRAKYDTPQSTALKVSTNLYTDDAISVKSLESALEYIKKAPSKDVITTYNSGER